MTQLFVHGEGGCSLLADHPTE